jgi:hypothetical protein
VIFHAAEDEKGACKVMSIFNNIGFMGYPVIAAAYGNSALLYAAVFTMIFNVLVYTYGIQTIRMDEKKGGFHLKSIINPGVISSLIALVLYVTQLPMPQFIKSTASGLSNLTGPISMMIIGVSLTRISVKDLFLDLRLLVYSFVKLLVVPILGTLLVKQFVSNQMLCQVCMVMLATPVASMTAMLAQQYQGNQMLVSKGVALTTVLSVVTIPLVSAIVF